MSLGAIAQIAQSGVSTFGNPLMTSVNQVMNRVLPVSLPNIYEAANLYMKGRYDLNQYLFVALSWGYMEKFALDILAGAQQATGLAELVTLYYRKKLGKDEATNYAEYIKLAQYNGVGKFVADKIIESREVIANENQLVQFMVREVFNEEISVKFGQYEEFPDDLPNSKTKILPEFAKIGVSEKLARWIWAAHWVLPEFGRAALALYRYRKEDRKFWQEEVEAAGLNPDDVETETTLIDTLLKTQDVMPFWRPRMLATTFQDLGQIQLRWAIRFGFIDYDRAVYEHKRQGLPTPYAVMITKIVKVVQSMTDWKTGLENGAISFADVEKELTEWHITEPNIVKILKGKLLGNELSSVTKYRDISLAKVVKAFKQNQIDRTKALELIKKLKYDEETAKFILEVETHEEIEAKPPKEKDLTKSDILAAFRVDSMTQQKAEEELIKLNYSKEEAQMLIDVEKAKKIGLSDKEKTKARDLTKSELLKSLKLGLRDAQSTFDGLIRLNYSDEEAIELIEQVIVALDKAELNK